MKLSGSSIDICILCFFTLGPFALIDSQGEGSFTCSKANLYISGMLAGVLKLRV